MEDSGHGETVRQSLSTLLSGSSAQHWRGCWSTGLRSAHRAQHNANTSEAGTHGILHSWWLDL